LTLIAGSIFSGFSYDKPRKIHVFIAE